MENRPMTTVSNRGYYHLFKIGLQYYIAGRSAALCQQIPVAGNLFHHAIEMLLKGDLAKVQSLGELKKLSHSLARIWVEFKAKHPAETLTPYDALIIDLDKIEELRYPDSVMRNGAAISMGWGTV